MSKEDLAMVIKGELEQLGGQLFARLFGGDDKRKGDFVAAWIAACALEAGRPFGVSVPGAPS